MRQLFKFLLLSAFLAVAVQAFALPEPKLRRHDTYPWMVQANTDVNMRAGVDEGTAKLATIPKWTRFYALSQATSYWVEVLYQGRKGYVFSSYIDFLYQVSPDGFYGKRHTEEKSGGSLFGGFFSFIWGLFRLMNSLLEKELLLETKTLAGSSYCVYNGFFSRWLEGM